MKKLLLTVATALTFISGAMAQAPDFGFETWNAIAPPFVTTKDPQGWASLNALTAVGTTQSVFQETTAPYAGTTSCMISTVKVTGASIPNPFRPGKNFDTAGFVGVGVISVATTSITFGYSITGRPSTLSFASKYTPMTGDSAFVFAYLTHFNGTTRDTIAYGKYATGTASSTYAAHSLTMNYKSAFSTVYADTMMVFASSSVYSHNGAKIGSTFYIDDMAWSGYTGINEITNAANKISVFPNPATSNITFASSVNADMVEVTDVTGRKVGMYSMIGNTVTVQTDAFAPGTYLYNVLNTKREIVNTGKFVITK